MKNKTVYFDWIAILLSVITVVINFLDITSKISLDNHPNLILIDNFILIYFVIEYIIRLFMAEKKLEFIKNNKLDLIACIPFNGIFKVFRIFKLFRFLKFVKLLRFIKIIIFVKKFNKKTNNFLKHNGFIYLLYLCTATIILGALGIYYLEKNITVKTFSDSLWWAFVTATTVGYGDVSPVTTLGRIIAVILMIFGIGTIGAFTGNVTSYFYKSGFVPKEDLENIFDTLTDEEKEKTLDFIEFLKSKRK